MQLINFYGGEFSNSNIMNNQGHVPRAIRRQAGSQPAVPFYYATHVEQPSWRMPEPDFRKWVKQYK